MSMKRFFGEIIKNKAIISEEENGHLRNVLRIKIGEEVVVFNGDGNDYVCKIENIGRNETVAQVIKKQTNKAIPKKDITLYLSAIKRDNLELVIQKAVELGCKRMVVFESERSTMKIQQEKMSRYEKIVLSACKQCERADFMQLKFLSFDNMLFDFAKHETKLFANEREGEKFDFSLLKDAKDIGILIGCEGGFSQIEKEKILKTNPENISLGLRILRAETASILLVGLASIISEN